MSAELLVNVTPRETRVALIESGVLQEIFIERASRRGLVGNIYKGRVCRVLPGMQAAFVDVGLDRAAFLHVSDIADADAQQVRDPPAPATAARTRRMQDRRRCFATARRSPISCTTDRKCSCRWSRNPIGTKGARLTTHVSIPSCYLVFIPGGATIGVSQRIEDEDERQRLRELVRDGARRAAGQGDGKGEDDGEDRIPDDGYIVRTAAEGCPESVVEADMAFLRKLWDSIAGLAASVNGPGIVHEDLTLVVRTLRELSATTSKGCGSTRMRCWGACSTSPAGSSPR